MGAAPAGKLIDLARSREPGDRERLLLSIVDLCESSPESGRPELRELLDDVFMALVVEAERDIRKVLAQKLSHADWAPKALINVLALDDIEIARPVILASPLLKDRDLIRLLVEATIEHQIEVARRPRLGSEVVEAIIDAGEPAVMTALANNTSAQVTEDAMRRLVDAARRVASLRSPLVRHPKLSKLMAERLYGWVGEALKAAIFERFGVEGAALDEAIADSVIQAQQGRAKDKPFVVERDGEREEMEARLIAKLKTANQLRPGYLLRALKEGKFSLFQGALATLGDFEVQQVRRALSAPDPEPLALACAAVGIDRSVFPSLLLMVRDLNGGRPGGDGEAGKRASAAFSRDPASATTAFRRHVGGV